jgi:Putative restriction endonuclease
MEVPLLSMARSVLPLKYHVDPDDPRAPPVDVWARLSSAERRRVVDSLPSELPVSEHSPPEGDEHFAAKTGARSALGGHFTRIGSRMYFGCDLPVYYPGERMFSPDVLAVLDVDPHKRERWSVSDEGRGLDFALEVIVSGRRRKDLVENVERFARLGIAEYFIFDWARMQLAGYRLPAARPGKKKRRYLPILPQGGRFPSQVLGLDLAIEDGRLRFFQGDSALLEADEMIASLERMLESIEARAHAAEARAGEETRKRKKETRLRKEETRLRKEETRLRKEEARLREGEARLRQEAERLLAEALAEIAHLKETWSPPP